MSDEAAFLAALKANPADDTTRLVYADWLDEHDQPQKAEYLRLVAAIARTGGDLTNHPEAAAIHSLASTLPEDWRVTTGSRFVATLFSYGHLQKINTIKHIREIVGCGLAEAKTMSESLPNRLLDRITFDRAREIALHLQNAPDTVAAVLPTELDSLPFTVTYDVVAGCNVWAQPRDQARLRRAARAALANFLVRALGLSPSDAARSAESELVVLERGLTAGEARDRARVLSQHLTPIGHPANWSVGVYTRHVAIETEST